jgi:hypothetical protein
VLQKIVFISVLALLISLVSVQARADNQEECGQIRAEIARQQSLAQMSGAASTTPMMAMGFQAVARKKIATLESRAADLQCTAAFSSTVAPTGQSFDQCFERCQQLTTRTKEQCFDSRNK